MMLIARTALSKIRQRLAHAHHHHVGEAALLVRHVAEMARRHHTGR